MAAFTSLVGPTLKDANGEVKTEDALNGKIVGLYFSAHWCPPCRGFTPNLAKIYNDIKGAGKNFEIVFVSSDRDEATFDEYRGEMPWLAIPFEDRTSKANLSSKFKVRGIPTLVLLDESGNLITTDGRATVSGDPTGQNFPWLPKSIPELIGDTLVGKDGNVAFDTLKGKKLALYFSAHWCPPCRSFTPVLAQLYKNMKDSTRDDFEFIFVSSDRNEGSFNEYYGEMPWLALPFTRREEKEALSQRFDVSGIPTLVTLDENMKVINKSARAAAGSDPQGADFPWYPKPVEELSATVESNGFDVNEKPSLIALCTGVAEAAAIETAMVEVAKEHIAGVGDKEPDFIFFTAKNNSGPVPQVLGMMGLGQDAAPSLLLLDIPDQGGFYTVKPETIDAASIKKVMSDYKEKKLERRQLASS